MTRQNAPGRIIGPRARRPHSPCRPRQMSLRHAGAHPRPSHPVSWSRSIQSVPARDSQFPVRPAPARARSGADAQPRLPAGRDCETCHFQFTFLPSHSMPSAVTRESAAAYRRLSVKLKANFNWWRRRARAPRLTTPRTVQIPRHAAVKRSDPPLENAAGSRPVHSIPKMIPVNRTEKANP